MLPPIEFFAVELAYSGIVASLCLFIYFKTREIYELSKYKGIYHFRNVFLFLSIAYLLRFILASFAFSTQLFDVKNEIFSGELLIVRPVVLLVAYFSFMAILSLTYSLMWKRIESGILQHDATLYVIALSLSGFIVLMRSHYLFILFHIALLTILVLTATINYKSSEKRKPSIPQIYFIYFLLFAFWIVNIAFIPLRHLQLELKVPFYAASILIISLIAYKVIKITS